MRTLQRGFTLVELMVAVAVVGIMAALAITAYGDYSARAQVSEGLELMGALRTTMQDSYETNGSWDVTVVSAVLSGKYVSAITDSNPTPYPNFATPGATNLQAEFRTVGVHPKIAGKKIHLYYNALSETWTCANGDASNNMTAAITAATIAVVGASAVPTEALPKACQ